MTDSTYISNKCPHPTLYFVRHEGHSDRVDDVKERGFVVQVKPLYSHRQCFLWINVKYVLFNLTLYHTFTAFNDP